MNTPLKSAPSEYTVYFVSVPLVIVGEKSKQK